MVHRVEVLVVRDGVAIGIASQWTLAHLEERVCATEHWQLIQPT